MNDINANRTTQQRLRTMSRLPLPCRHLRVVPLVAVPIMGVYGDKAESA
ncbi:hypothetical protein OK016_29425 [Vibrio chagasii]|nr:hypothetical protein [Vibrio chagasii]